MSMKRLSIRISCDEPSDGDLYGAWLANEVSDETIAFLLEQAARNVRVIGIEQMLKAAAGARKRGAR